MEKYISAAIVGLSVSNFWLCGLYACSLGAADPGAAVRFIIGRILGLLFIGIWIGLLGRTLAISPWQMDILFGIISVLFGFYMIFKKGVGRADALTAQGTGFGVGFIRGATPCIKVLVMTPLLSEDSLLGGLGLMMAYAMASSIYPIVGFGFSTIIGRLYGKRRLIKNAGGGVMILIGLYYILKRLFIHSIPSLPFF